VIIVLSIYLFLRGHDQPGGGFIAGITLSTGFVLQYLAGGTKWVEDRLRIRPTLWIGSGLLLALLTGVFDFVPVIGVFLTAIPMILLALTVSPTAAVATAIFNAVYNAVETYYISPKVYGNQLRLSSLAVILGFALGGELGGGVGALISLPIVALYPTIENIWLRDRLAPEVLQDHRRIEQTEEH
jgi:multisubunit Na+/H+ antiporter MnhB subunit